MPPKRRPSRSTRSSDADQHVFAHQDLVLAKITGYSPWPALVIDEDLAPPHIVKAAKTRSINQIVRFFHTKDYGLITQKCIWPLDGEAIASYLKKTSKGAKGLRSAYEAALKYLDGEYSFDDDEEEDDEHASDEEEDEVQDSSAENRSESEVESDVEVKTESTTRKSQPRTSNRATKKPKQRSSSSDAVNVSVNGSTEGATQDMDSGFLKVKGWRFDLQRLFFGRDSQLPDQSSMQQVDSILRQMEAYKGITAEQLAYSKVIKVLKKILVQLSLVGSYEQFEMKYHFRPRIEYLLRSWLPIVGTNSHTAALEEQDLTQVA